MTKNSGKKKVKFNPLHKGGGLSYRKDHIDTEYIKGVYDDSGKQVIRPLNKQELEWLSRFYNEEVNVTFEESARSKQLKNKYKKLAKKHKDYKATFNEDHPEVLQVKKELEAERELLGNFNYKNEDRSKLYNKDYIRREDLMSVSKAMGDLINFDIQEYDKFTYQAAKDLDPEHLVYSKYKELKTRKKS